MILNRDSRRNNRTSRWQINLRDIPRGQRWSDRGPESNIFVPSNAPSRTSEAIDAGANVKLFRHGGSPGTPTDGVARCNKKNLAGLCAGFRGCDCETADCR